MRRDAKPPLRTDYIEQPKFMNLISDLESELAYAVLIEKKHSEKISSEEVLPLIKRLNDALESVSAKVELAKAVHAGVKPANNFSH